MKNNDFLKHPLVFLAVLVLLIMATIVLVAAAMQPDLRPAPLPDPAQVLPVQLYAEPAQVAAPEKMIVVQDNSFTLNDAPTHWTVCVNEARVYNNPGENPDWYIYSLPEGTPVMVRELDASRTFAMIQPAEYTVVHKSLPIGERDVGSLCSYCRGSHVRLRSPRGNDEEIQGAILFIDEIHTLVGAGATHVGSMMPPTS